MPVSFSRSYFILFFCYCPRVLSTSSSSIERKEWKKESPTGDGHWPLEVGLGTSGSYRLGGGQEGPASEGSPARQPCRYRPPRLLDHRVVDRKPEIYFKSTASSELQTRHPSLFLHHRFYQEDDYIYFYLVVDDTTTTSKEKNRKEKKRAWVCRRLVVGGLSSYDTSHVTTRYLTSATNDRATSSYLFIGRLVFIGSTRGFVNITTQLRSDR